MSGLGEDMEFDEVVFGGAEDRGRASPAQPNQWRSAGNQHKARGVPAASKASNVSIAQQQQQQQQQQSPSSGPSSGNWRSLAGRGPPAPATNTTTSSSASDAMTVPLGTSESSSSFKESAPALDEPASPNDTIVIKNLPYALTKRDIETYLTGLTGFAPENIRLFTDAEGNFRGIAFVKYSTTDEGIKAYSAVEGEQVMGRKVRVEYRKPPSEDRRAARSSFGPSSLPGTSSMQQPRPGGRLPSANPSPVLQSQQQPQSQQVVSPQMMLKEAGGGPELDLTNSFTRETLDRVKDFYDNPRVSALSFSPKLTPAQVVVVLQVAESFRLDSQYVDEAGSTRYLQLCKKPLRANGPAPDASSASRAKAISIGDSNKGTKNGSSPGTNSFTSPRMTGLSGGASSGSFKESGLSRSWNSAGSRVRAGSRASANQRISRGPDGPGFSAGRGKPLSKLLKPGPPMTDLSLNAEEFVPPSRRQQQLSAGVAN